MGLAKSWRVQTTWYEPEVQSSFWSSSYHVSATLLLVGCLKSEGWKITGEQVAYLTYFFTDRLADYGCHHEVLLGLHVLLTHYTLPSGAEQRVARSIFSEVHVQVRRHPRGVAFSFFWVFGHHVVFPLSNASSVDAFVFSGILRSEQLYTRQQLFLVDIHDWSCRVLANIRRPCPNRIVNWFLR